MATAVGLGGCLHHPKACIHSEVACLAHQVRVAWATRPSRPWLSVLAAPLAMTAASLSGQWWAWALLIPTTVGWSPRERWVWVLAIQEGIVGAQWAYVGAASWAAFPTQHPLVALLWVAFPAALATTGWWSHRRAARR